MYIFQKTTQAPQESLAEKQARKEYRIQVLQTAHMILEKSSKRDYTAKPLDHSYWLQFHNCVPTGFVASIQFEDDVNEIIQRLAKQDLTVTSITSKGVVNVHLSK